LPKLAVKNQATRGRLWSFCRPAPRAVGDLLCRSDPSRGMQAALLFASVYGVQRVKLFGYSDDMQYSDGTAMKIWHDQYKEHAALRDVGLLPPVSAGGEAEPRAEPLHATAQPLGLDCTHGQSRTGGQRAC